MQIHGNFNEGVGYYEDVAWMKWETGMEGSREGIHYIE